MARAAKPIMTTKSVAGRRKPGRPAVEAANPPPKAPEAAKPSKAAVPKRAMPVAAPVQKLKVAELRAYVAKLERSLVTLRGKHREVARAAKTDAARIAELERQVGEFEAKAAHMPAAKRGAKPPLAPAARTKRQSRRANLAEALPSELGAEAERENPEHRKGE